MPILSLTNGLYSNAKEIVRQLISEHGYVVVTDEQIIDQTSSEHGIKESILRKTIQSKQLAFNDFTHEKEKCIACLKQVLSHYIKSDNYLFHGILPLLIPKNVSQVMRILVITDKTTRIKNGMSSHGQSKKEAKKAITLFDKHAILWANTITGKGAFDESLYDIVLPTDKLSTKKSIELITEHSQNLNTLSKEVLKKEREDFELAAQVEVALTGVGSKLLIQADNGNILITIDKNVMMLSKFKQKITNIVNKLDHVKDIEIKLGKNYYSNTIVRKLDVETPARLLLVDDEKAFVQTLSERLKLRQLPSEIAYNGEQALELSENNDMEVMVLDLKMPGIDGFEVLKKIKETKPHIEVIILTGHGSEKDKEKCMELGAFAYLEKPADIDLLTTTMKRAYEKINAEE